MTLTWNAGPVIAHLTAASERGVLLAMEALKAASVQVAPVEEATLIGSAVASTDGLRGAVSYDTPYAVRQHEDTNNRHDPGKIAKYLEVPSRTEAPTMLAVIAAELRGAL